MENWAWIHWNGPGQRHDDIIDNLKTPDLYSVCGVFRSGLIIFVPYARRDSPNVIEQVHLRGFNYSKEPFAQKRKSALAFTYNLAPRQRGPSEPLSETLARAQECICLRRERKDGSHIDLLSLSQRRRTQTRGRSKMEALAPHYIISPRRKDIGSPPNWLWSLYTAARVVKKTLPRFSAVSEDEGLDV